MNKSNDFRLLPITAALLAVFGNAYAQDSGEIHDLVTPSSSLSVGVGAVNNTQDAKRFGQYSGMNKGDPYGLFDLSLIRRDDSTGTWIIMQGRDLGLDTRELGFTHQKQGDWKYSVDYSEMVRHDPYVIHTGMSGVGTATPTINLIARPTMPATWATANGLAASNGVAGSDIELKIKRTAFGISAEKWLSPEWQVEASFRTEERKGARMFGRAGLASGDLFVGIPTSPGAVGKWAVLLTPEPISSVTNLVETKVSFNRDKLALTGGYFGSFYNNDYGSMSPVVPGTLNRGPLTAGGTPAGAASIAQLASASVALPPDNQAHQVYLSGTYGFTKDTRANFKLSYTHATQNESFAAQGLTAATTAPGSLGGEVNTTLAMFGLTSRVTKDLTLKASLRYEDRDDQTPVYVYNQGKTGGALDGTTNWPSASQTRTTAKAEGVYRFQNGYSALLGVDWELKKTPYPVANSAIFNKQVFFRPELEEYGIHGELRKALSENLNGAVGIEYKERRGNGGAWVTGAGTVGNPLVSANPALLNNVFPDMYMDRDRTKVRASVDWAPVERLDLQAVYEHAVDQYRRDAPSTYVQTSAPAGTYAAPFVAGAREMVVDSVSLDGSFALSDNWKLNGYLTQSEYRWNVNKVNIGEDTRNSSQTIGLGVKGQVNSRLDVGLDLMSTRDTTRFTNQVVTNGVVGNIAGWVGQPLPGNTLPKIHYNTERVKFFAKYALDKSSDLRFDAIYQHFKTDDWQWGYNGIPFLYSDNTTVSQPMNQNALFVGARYIYKF